MLVISKRNYVRHPQSRRRPKRTLKSFNVYNRIFFSSTSLITTRTVQPWLEYLAVGQNGAEPVTFEYTYVAPSNTGIPSGVDLDNSGSVGGPNDAFGFGFFPGQFGMAFLSRYPIKDVRTFQAFRWVFTRSIVFMANALPFDIFWI